MSNAQAKIRSRIGEDAPEKSVISENSATANAETGGIAVPIAGNYNQVTINRFELSFDLAEKIKADIEKDET